MPSRPFVGVSRLEAGGASFPVGEDFADVTSGRAGPRRGLTRRAAAPAAAVASGVQLRIFLVQ